MKKTLIVTVSLCALIGLGLASSTFGNGAVDGEEPGMMVSPQTIVLSKIAAVTVHTNIPAVTVVRSSVTLNGVKALYVWADDCGHIAARFLVADLALEPGEVTLTLCGDYVTPGESFVASDVVRAK